MLSRRIIKIYNDIVQKHGNATVKDFRKYEKLKYKLKKPKLDINFSNNYKQINAYPKFLNFKLQMFQIKMLYQYVKDSFTAYSINVIKNLNMSQKNSVDPKPFYSNNYLLLASASLIDL